MTIYVNNQLREIDTQSSIDTLLSSLSITTQKGIAIAVNDNVVPRNEWDHFQLKEADKITLIKATQGG